jgi:imidazole glycerol-phosphate synthase subunit HisH
MYPPVPLRREIRPESSDIETGCRPRSRHRAYAAAGPQRVIKYEHHETMLMEQKIVIVDYGMGNVGSIRNMLKHIGFAAVISGTREDIKSADKLILSGVGAFDSAMNKISGAGILDVLNIKVMEEKTPILGICLGMQLFSHSSEEGLCRGLGWIDAQTVRFSFTGAASRLKVPHMGWNTLTIRKPHPLFQGMPGDMRFYFVHSYHIHTGHQDMSLATTHYGYDFASAIAKDNICGVQFHPEKSHKFGMTLLNNFVNLTKQGP